LSTKHPTDRGDEGRSPFDRLAELASNLTSSPLFFAGCIALITALFLSYLLDGSGEWQHLLGSSVSAVSLLLLALLKNSEKRAEQAIQEKHDAIAAAMLEQRHGDEQEAAEELARAIGLHDEV